MAEDTRPMYNAAVVPAHVTVDPDGTLVLSDDSEFDPDRDGADADLGEQARPPPPPPPPRPGYHPDVRARVDSYATQLPGKAWTVDPANDPDKRIAELRARATGVYWESVPKNPRAGVLWNQNRLPGKGHKYLAPALRDDVRIIGSATRDNRISNMAPLIVTAKRNTNLLKSDIAYFLRSTGVIEYRMMDALFAAVAAVPEVQGPLARYDYGTATRGKTVALPAITWEHILRKFRYLEGEGSPPAALPEYMPGFLDPATSQPGDPTNIHPTVKAAHSILLPIRLHGNHWMFAFIAFRRRTTLIINSDYKGKDAQEDYRTVEKYLHYWNSQNLEDDPTFYPDRWDTIHVPGVTLGRVSRVQASGLASVLGALLIICNVDPEKNVPVVPTDLRAFFAAALAEGGFRGDYYFPRQDRGNTRAWGDLFTTRGFFDTLGRPIIRNQAQE